MPSKDKEVYVSLKPVEQVDHNIIPPKVVLVTGVTFSGERTVLRGKPFTLDLPSREAGGTIVMTSGGGNMFSQLQKSINNQAGGPWFPQGRDGELTIKNRNYNQKPVASYIFMGGKGELLSFSAKTTRTEKTLDTTSSTDINPDDKTVNTINTQGTSTETSAPQNNGPEYTRVDGKLVFRKKRLPSTSIGYSSLPTVKSDNLSEEQLKAFLSTKNNRNIIRAYTPKAVRAESRIIRDNYVPSKEDSNKYIEELRAKQTDLMNRVKAGDKNALVDLLDLGDLGTFTVKRKAWVVKTVNPGDYGNQENVPQNPYSDAGRSSLWLDGYANLKSREDIKIIPKAKVSGNTAMSDANRYNINDSVQVAQYVEVEVPIDGARMLTSAEPVTNSSVNDIVKTLQEEVTGDFKILGNPHIESEMMLAIEGVSKKYSGHWYIKSIKHKIDTSGYTCDGQVIKKGSTISVRSVASSSNMKQVYSVNSRITKLAKARSERDKAGITAESLIKESIQDFYREQEAKGTPVDPSTSLQVVVPESFGTYTGGKIHIPIYKAGSDIVNFKKEAASQKAQAKKLMDKKK